VRVGQRSRQLFRTGWARNGDAGIHG
jgi:hypothetical protein